MRFWMLMEGSVEDVAGCYRANSNIVEPYLLLKSLIEGV